MNIIFPLSVVYRIMGGGLFLCMNSNNVCISLYMYVVCMHVCVHVCLANDFINVKTETE